MAGGWSIQMYGPQQSSMIIHRERPKPETTAEPQGKPKWNGRTRFLGLGAERYRRNRQPIIDGKPLAPDRSRKG
jgi:hypothetical protein